MTLIFLKHSAFESFSTFLSANSPTVPKGTVGLFRIEI